MVGDLQRQRQELSLQVRQLTEKSHSLSEQIRPGPTGVAGMCSDLSPLILQIIYCVKLCTMTILSSQ